MVKCHTLHTATSGKLSVDMSSKYYYHVKGNEDNSTD